MSRDPTPPQKDFVPGLAVRVIAEDAVMLGEKRRLIGRHGLRAASPDYLRFLP
jgi:hypothetical protein